MSGRAAWPQIMGVVLEEETKIWIKNPILILWETPVCWRCERHMCSLEGKLKVPCFFMWEELNILSSVTLPGLGSELIQQQPCQRNCDIAQHKENLTALPPFVPRDRLLLEVGIAEKGVCIGSYSNQEPLSPAVHARCVFGGAATKTPDTSIWKTHFPAC